MKPLGIIRTGVLLLLLGTVAPTYAQQDEHQQAKPAKQDQQVKREKQQPDRNKPPQRNNGRPQQKAQKQQRNQNKQQEQRAQKQQQDENKRQPQSARQPDQHRKQQHAQHPAPNNAPQQRHDYRASQQGQRVQQSQHREVWQQHRARNWQSEHRDWRQRGGYTGYRIPENHYRGNFGANHWFRIHRYPLETYGGHPRFWYAGFWFGFMDPWPEYWADDWYDNDDVYVVYSEDGYYLYNRRYPRDRIAITVYVD